LTRIATVNASLCVPDEKLAAFMELESAVSELTPEGGGRIAPRRNRLAIGNSN
jgi:hypothetical protein